MINFLKILVSQISYNERLTIIQIIVFFSYIFCVIFNWFIDVKSEKKTAQL